MTIVKHFLGNRKRPAHKRGRNDPQEHKFAKRSFFFNQQLESSAEEEVPNPELHLYVSSKGYFSH